MTTNAVAAIDLPCLERERLERILRECRISHLSEDEKARVRLFFARSGVRRDAPARTRAGDDVRDVLYAALPMHAAR